MKFDFFNSFSYIIILYFFILIISLSIFIPIFSNYGYIYVYTPSNNLQSLKLSAFGFTWPTPGYTTITSKFGYRVAPTSGASSYHSGIDIGAPTGSDIVAIFTGTVSYIGFSGARWLYSYCKK